LQNIIDARDSLGLDRIFYGHFDYSFDVRHWPMPRQDSWKFWTFIHTLIQRIEAAGLGYIHPPLSELGNDSLLRQIICKLLEQCTLRFGMTTLCERQTVVACSNMLHHVMDYQPDMKPSAALARKTISIFEQNTVSKRSFSVNRDDLTLITPHEYIMAKDYLSSHGKD